MWRKYGMIKKILSVSICAFTLWFTATPVYAEENAVEDTAGQIVEELDGEIISPEDVPEGVTPIEFDSVEEAQEFIEQLNEELDDAEMDMSTADDEYPEESGSGLRKRAKGDIGVKSVKCDYSLGEMAIYANYEYANNKFTKITNVKSTYNGLINVIATWTQETWGGNITNNGKQMNVSVYGHYDIFAIIKNSTFKVESRNKTWWASWDY